MKKILVLLFPFFVFYAGCSKDSYIGDSEKGVRQGYGVMNYSDGSKYEGYWVNNKKHGKGIFTYENGARHEGNFKNGKKNGAGKFFWPNGDIFEGTFKDDNFHIGKLTTVTGQICEGEYDANARLNGRGECQYPEGLIVEGLFKNGLQSDQGKRIYPEGVVIEGDFQNGLLNGKGKLIVKDVVTLDAVWRGGEFVKFSDDKNNKDNVIKFEKWRKEKILEKILKDSVGNVYQIYRDTKTDKMFVISEDSDITQKIVYSKLGKRETRITVSKKTAEKISYIWDENINGQREYIWGENNKGFWKEVKQLSGTEKEVSINDDSKRFENITEEFDPDIRTAKSLMKIGTFKDLHEAVYAVKSLKKNIKEEKKEEAENKKEK